MDDYLTTKDVARVFRVSIETVHFWARQETIRWHPSPVGRLYDREEIERHIRAGWKGKGEPPSIETLANGGLLKPHEASEHLRMPPATVAFWGDMGRFPYLLTPGGRRRYFAASIWRARRIERELERKEWLKFARGKTPLGPVRLPPPESPEKLPPQANHGAPVANQHLTTEDVAAIFNVSAQSVLGWTRAGHIKCDRHFHGNIYARTEIKRVIQKGCPEAEASLIEEALREGMFNHREVAKILNITPERVTKLVDTGKINSIKTPGGTARFPKRFVKQYRERRA